MRIGVVQHDPTDDESLDLRALRDGVAAAAERGACSVVVPCVEPIARDSSLYARFRSLVGDDHPDVELVIPCPGGSALVPTAFGLAALRLEDACLRADGDAAGARAFVWQFTPESEIQAEGLLEFAIAVSLHTPGLVITAATGSADEGWRARGSAIVQVGMVLAEAGDGNDVIVADVPDPMLEPEPPGPHPVLPVILAQRLAAHEGRKIVPPWPADMS